MNRPVFILLIIVLLSTVVQADVPPDPGFVRQSIALALETDQDLKDHRFFLVSAISLDEVKLRQGERTFVGAEGHAGAARVVRL
ncbi:MAG: hypothetical protein ABI539_10590, partial [Acidobacteriota bacterium]